MTFPRGDLRKSKNKSEIHILDQFIKGSALLAFYIDGPLNSDFSNKCKKKTYQIEAGVCPNINPGQGMSDPVGALRDHSYIT